MEAAGEGGRNEGRGRRGNRRGNRQYNFDCRLLAIMDLVACLAALCYRSCCSVVVDFRLEFRGQQRAGENAENKSGSVEVDRARNGRMDVQLAECTSIPSAPLMPQHAN